MIGVIVNTFAVVVGGTIGLAAKKIIPEGWSDFIMKGLALCVLYIGVDGALTGENTLVTIISMAIGAVVGVAIDLDEKLNRFARGLESKVKGSASRPEKSANRVKGSEESTSIAEGFVTASLLFCVGAMTIVGSLQAGLTGDNTMLFTKSTLDFISSVVFAASLGAGVLFAACFVLAFQGAIVLLAQAVEPFLGAGVISEMTCVGSILIIALGLNMLKITELKVMNYLPAIFMPIILCPLFAVVSESISAWI